MDGLTLVAEMVPPLHNCVKSLEIHAPTDEYVRRMVCKCVDYNNNDGFIDSI